MNGSGHNRQKEESKHACMGWTRWTPRMHGVDKMDKEENSKEGEKWKEEGFWRGVNEGRKDHGFGLGTS